MSLITTVITGIGINIFTDWLSKHGDKSKKREEIYSLINNTLNQQVDKLESITQEFLALFQQTIKNSDEIYTQRLDSLLSNLKESGLLQEMAEAALLNKGISHLETSIEYQVEKYFQPDETLFYNVTAKELNSALYEVIQQIIPLLSPEQWLVAQLKHIKEHSSKPRFPLYLPEKKIIKDGHLSWQDFRYDFELTDFQGRTTELNHLTQFLESTAPLSWTLLYGSGGSGKSRLALELCRKNPQWHAGFFSPNHQDVYTIVATHRFHKDTLIIIDYAATRTAQVKGLLEAINNYQVDGWTEFKIRILLIERNWHENIHWYKDYKSQFAKLLSSKQFNSGFKKLGPLTNEQLWIIMQGVANHQNVSLSPIDQEQYLAKLSQLEKNENRVLITMLLANSLVNKKNVTFKHNEELLEDIFLREETYWKQIDYNEKLQVLLCLGTLCGGLSINALQDKIEGFISLNTLCRTLFTNSQLEKVQQLFGHDNTTYIPAITPDLLGEYFVLRFFRKANEVFGLKQDAIEVLILALAFSTTTSQILKRICEDFPANNPILDCEHEITSELASHQDIAAGWLQLQSILLAQKLFDNKITVKILLEHWEGLKEIFAGNELNDIVLTHGLSYAMGVGQLKHDSVMEAEVFQKLHAFTKTCKNNLAVDRILAKAFTNQVANANQTELSTFYYKQLQELKLIWPHDDEILVEQAKSAVSLINIYGEVEQLPAATGYYTQLQDLLKLQKNSEQLTIEQSFGLINLIVHYGKARIFTQTLTYYNQLQNLVAIWPKNQTLALSLAIGSTHMIYYYGNAILIEKTKQFYHQIENLVRTWPANEEVAIEYAKGTFNLVTDHCLAQQPNEAKIYYDKLEVLIGNWDKNQEIASEYAKATLNLISYYCKVSQQGKAKPYYSKIQKLVSLWPSSMDMVFVQAQAIFNLLLAVCTKTQLNEAELYYNQLQSISFAYDKDEKIAIKLAKATVSIIETKCFTNQPEGIKSYHTQLKTLVATSPANEEISLALSIAIVNLIAYKIRINQVEQAIEYYGELQKLHSSWLNSEYIAQILANGSFMLFKFYENLEDKKMMTHYYDILAKLTEFHPKNKEIGKQLADANINLIIQYFNEDRLNEIIRYYAKLKELTLEWPNEIGITHWCFEGMLLIAEMLILKSHPLWLLSYQKYIIELSNKHSQNPQVKSLIRNINTFFRFAKGETLSGEENVIFENSVQIKTDLELFLIHNTKNQ